MMKFQSIRRFNLAPALTVLLAALAPFAAGAAPEWTASAWDYSQGFSPAANNLMRGLLDTSGVATRARLTDGEAAFGTTTAVVIGNDISLSWDLPAPADIEEIRVYTTWQDTGRVNISIDSIDVMLVDGTEQTITPGAHANGKTGSSSFPFSYLRDSEGALLTSGVSRVTLNFGQQQNSNVGYAEIEVIGERATALDIVGSPLALSTPRVNDENAGYGLSLIEAGAELTATVSETTGTTPSNRYALAGWTLRRETAEGSVTETSSTPGTKTTCTLTPAKGELASLTWLWDVEFKPSITGEGGTVTFDREYYRVGDRMTATATPNAGMGFVKWTGVPDRLQYANPLVYYYDSAQSITAVYAPALYVTAGGSAGADGSTPANATTIQHALSLATNGMVIAVAKGHYGITTTLTVDKGVTVRGLTGDWDDVVFDATNKCRVFNLTGSGAVVTGVTASRGSGAGGGFNIGKSATVANGRATGCVGSGYNSGIGACNAGKLYSSLIDGNKSGVFGCAGVINTDWGTPIIDGCVITNNWTDKGQGTDGTPSGGLRLEGAGGYVRNSFIAYNHVDSWTDLHGERTFAVGVVVSAGTLENCTIYGNWYNGAGDERITAGVNSAGGTIRNCIIAGNGIRHGKADNWRGTAAKFSNCMVEAADLPGTAPVAFAGVDSLVIDPVNGLPRLPPGSSAIGAGASQTWQATGVDLDGFARVCGAVDIGCVEYHPGDLAVDFTPLPEVAFGSFTATLAARLSGPAYTGLVYDWRVNGTAVATTASFDLALTASGSHTVSLTVTATNSATAVWSDTVELAASRFLYVAPTGGSIAPFASWETAATSLQDALGAAPVGAEIIVSNGTYTHPAALLATRPVTVRGLTGNRDDVTLDGGNARRVLQITDDAVTFANLTIARGKLGSPGAGVYMMGGTFTNCRVTACTGTANYYGGSGAGVYMCGGRFIDCLIDRNTFTGDIVAGLGFYMQGGESLIDRTWVVSNSLPIASLGDGSGWASAIYMNGGQVRNAVVADNSVDVIRGWSPGNARRVAPGIRMDRGAVENTLIYRNGTTGSAPHPIPGVSRSGGTVRNCIFLENGELNGGIVTDYVGSVSALINCCTTIAESTGAVAPGPEAFTFETPGAYPRIMMGSTLIDAGDGSSAWMQAAGILDLARTNRVSGTGIDIGPFEYRAPPFACLFQADAYDGLSHLDTTLVASTEGGEGTITYAWYVNDEGTPRASGADQSTFHLVLDTVGTTTVRLVATDASSGRTAEWTRVFTVSPKTLYVVKGNAGAAAPYGTWAKAAADIAAAVSAAVAGAEVVVSNETYAPATTLKIDKPITVRGATGNFGDVVITGSGQRLVVHLANTGAVLSGVTVRDGAKGDYTGGIWVDGGGCVTNCRVTACSMNSWRSGYGYGGCAIQNTDGTVVDTVIDGIRYDGWVSGMGLGITGDRALVDRCVITNVAHTGGAKYYVGAAVYIDSGTLRNSLIAWNRNESKDETSLDAMGVHVGGGMLESCTVVQNLALHTNSIGAIAGVYCGANGRVRNCLIADNGCITNGASVTTFDPVNDCNGTLANYSFCCTSTELAGEGNVAFQAGAYTWNDEKKRLGLPTRSVCIGAGANQEWMRGATDLHGSKRVFGTRIDIGCLECQRSAGSVISIR